MTNTQYLSMVSEIFNFLCRDFGFIQVIPYAYTAIYRTNKYEIRIVYDRQRSYEICCDCCEAGGSSSYSLHEILQLKNRPMASQYAFFQTTKIEEVNEILDDIARVIKSDVLDILQEKDIFIRLKIQQEKMSEDYRLQLDYQTAQFKSETAWKQKDYAAYINLLEPFEELLIPSEKEKIKYAKKQVSK